MTTQRKTLSASQSLQGARTFGKVRCHNPSCMGRMAPAAGAERITCPVCGMAYRLFWVTPELPRIRGPVWEVNRRLAKKKPAEKSAKTVGE